MKVKRPRYACLTKGCANLTKESGVIVSNEKTAP